MQDDTLAPPRMRFEHNAGRFCLGGILRPASCREQAANQRRPFRRLGSESLSIYPFLSRGDVIGVTSAIEVHGRFLFTGNHISGFDERDSYAPGLVADPLGRVGWTLYRGNIIERCAGVATQTQKGLWHPAGVQNNIIK